MDYIHGLLKCNEIFLKGSLTAVRRRDGGGVGVRKQKLDRGDQFKNAWINCSER